MDGGYLEGRRWWMGECVVMMPSHCCILIGTVRCVCAVCLVYLKEVLSVVVTEKEKVEASRALEKASQPSVPNLRRHKQAWLPYCK